MGAGRHIIAALLLASSLGVCASGCATAQTKREELGRAVKAYSQFIRWKKYDGAVAFRLPEEQAEFMARYSAAEDDLHVESIETRSVTFLPQEDNQPLQANVVVVAHAYLLPSTVLEKVLMQQTWEYREGRWVLLSSSRELAPPVDESALGGHEGLGTEQPVTVPKGE